jgi:hypothetical protein
VQHIADHSRTRWIGHHGLCLSPRRIGLRQTRFFLICLVLPLRGRDLGGAYALVPIGSHLQGVLVIGVSGPSIHAVTVKARGGQSIVAAKFPLPPTLHVRGSVFMAASRCPPNSTLPRWALGHSSSGRIVARLPLGLFGIILTYLSPPAGAPCF